MLLKKDVNVNSLTPSQLKTLMNEYFIEAKKNNNKVKVWQYQIYLQAKKQYNFIINTNKLFYFNPYRQYSYKNKTFTP